MKQILRNLLLIDSATDEDPLDERYKVLFINSILLLTAAIAFVMGFIRWRESVVMGAIDFSFVGLNMMMFYYLRHQTHRLNLIASLLLLQSFVFFFAIYILAPYNSTRLSLFFLILVAAFFLKGQKIAMFWMFLIIASLLTVHFCPAVVTGYTHIDMLTFTFYLLGLFVTLNIYEDLKEARGRRLAQLNTHLEELVQQRTEKLSESAWALNKAQEIAHLGSWERRLQEGTLNWSDEQFRIFGYEPGAMTPSLDLFWAAVHPDDLARVKASVEKAVDNNCKSPQVEYRIRRPNNEERWVSTEARVLRDQKGQPLQLIGTVYDITEKKLLESQLIQTGKLASVGELAAGIAHELNQPLMVIRSKNQLLQRRLRNETIPPEQIAEATEMVERNTKRMMNIINHLRAFARQSEQAQDVVRINKVIDDCFLLIGEQLRLLDIQIKKVFAPGLPRIQADGNRLEQVFLNLLGNARDAVVEKREKCADKERYQAEIVIHTGMSEAKTHLVILISDNGGGIPPGLEKTIFDPFVTSKEVGKGTGLGLSISYGIIKEHGGEIRVAKSGPEGTTFSVELPVG